MASFRKPHPHQFLPAAMAAGAVSRDILTQYTRCSVQLHRCITNGHVSREIRVRTCAEMSEDGVCRGSHGRKENGGGGVRLDSVASQPAV